MMRIRLNGQQTDTAATTVAALLAELNLITHRRGTAVAVNERVVRRDVWGDTVLEEGDIVEIIHAVQGGR